MLIQDAIFPDLEEVKAPTEVQTELFKDIEEKAEESASKEPEVNVPRNKGGRPRKN